MSRLLAYTSPARGHLYPIVPILLELQRRGHEVAVCTLAAELETVGELPLQARPISTAVEAIEMDDYRASWQGAKVRRAMATLLARAEHEVPDLLAAIADHDPDLLLIDVNSWGAAIAAEASGLPWAMYSPYLLALPSREAPPFGFGLHPARGALGRARDAALKRLGNAVLDHTVVRSLNARRACYGLPAVEHFADLLLRPSLLLALTAEGFEYPRSDWPANVRLVGPSNWAPAQRSEHAYPAWLSELEDPLVLVTCSTERQRDQLLIESALRGLPPAGFSVLATTAAHDPDAFEAPAGSRVVRFLPHGAVLARAACVVCHGGMGIAQKALAAGVPVVVVPFGRDQLETARRVELAGAGVRLPTRRLTPVRLAEAVRQAIGRRPQAERIAQIFAAAGGAERAAELLEALSRRGGVSSPAMRLADPLQQQ